MIGLSAVWQDRYARTHELADLTAAIDVLGTVADAGAATTRDRERAARERGDLLAGHEDWAEAAAAYSAAVAMLHLLAWRGLDRGSQEWQLGRRLRSVGNATACAIAAGNPSGAVEALEHGRAVLWNQLLDSRADLTALTATRPEIARRLAEIRTALDEPAAHKARPTASRRERGRRQSQPRRVNMRWRIMQTPSVTRTTTG